MKKILLLNGPSLGLLGTREPAIYGRTTLAEIVAMVKDAAAARGAEVTAIQSDVEGELAAAILGARGAYDGIILNPAAYTHESVALHDAIAASEVPTVEVHLSDVTTREEFRQVSYIRSAAVKTIMGKGVNGYLEAVAFLAETCGGGAEK